MSNEQDPLPKRVAESFSLLSAASKDLNIISGELGKYVGQIDLSMKRLNLGLSAWIPISKYDGLPESSWYWTEDVGYAKIGSNWGIALRKISGDYQNPEEEQEERWLFNDAPRTLRISAIEKLPELLEKLSSEAVKTTQHLSTRLSEVQQIAEAVNTAALSSELVQPRRRTPLIIASIASNNGQKPSLDDIRKSVSNALVLAGHTTAAQLISSGTWRAEQDLFRIEVMGMGKKMLALTVNAAAEKIIRAQLIELGMPPRFTVLPGAATAQPLHDQTDSSDTTRGGK